MMIIKRRSSRRACHAMTHQKWFEEPPLSSHTGIDASSSSEVLVKKSAILAKASICENAREREKLNSVAKMGTESKGDWTSQKKNSAIIIYTKHPTLA